MQLVKILCTCTQCHHKVKLTLVFWRGAGSTQCLYNNGRLFLPSTPICNHRETVITFNITYAHFNGVAFTTSYFKDKAHKSPSSNFCNCVLFFSILFHFFPSFFFFSEKKGVIVMMMQQIGNWNATLKFRKPILLVTMEGRMKNLKCPDIRLYSKEADSDPNHREELFPLKNTDRLQEITAASLK